MGSEALPRWRRVTAAALTAVAILLAAAFAGAQYGLSAEYGSLVEDAMLGLLWIPVALAAVAWLCAGRPRAGLVMLLVFALLVPAGTVGARQLGDQARDERVQR